LSQYRDQSTDSGPRCSASGTDESILGNRDFPIRARADENTGGDSRPRRYRVSLHGRLTFEAPSGSRDDDIRAQLPERRFRYCSQLKFSPGKVLCVFSGPMVAKFLTWGKTMTEPTELHACPKFCQPTCIIARPRLPNRIAATCKRSTLDYPLAASVICNSTSAKALSHSHTTTRGSMASPPLSDCAPFVTPLRYISIHFDTCRVNLRRCCRAR
jgi:hypothetical protein